VRLAATFEFLADALDGHKRFTPLRLLRVFGDRAQGSADQGSTVRDFFCRGRSPSDTRFLKSHHVNEEVTIA
jgi:hypothetical protein